MKGEGEGEGEGEGDGDGDGDGDGELDHGARQAHASATPTASNKLSRGSPGILITALRGV